MTYFIAAYCLLTVASCIVMVDKNTKVEWIAAIIAAPLWPIILTVRIIRAIDKILSK